jgi:hypothetical protein
MRIKKMAKKRREIMKTTSFIFMKIANLTRVNYSQHKKRRSKVVVGDK